MSVADKLTTIAENEQKVFEAGQKVEYDNLWDNIQHNGTRTNYTAIFRNWQHPEIKPKYPIKTTTLYDMFNGAKNIVSFDWSLFSSNYADGCYDSAYCFCTMANSLKEINIDIKLKPNAPSGSAFQNTFNSCYALEKVQKIEFQEQCNYSNTFNRCDSLKELGAEGVIGKDINFRHSTLLNKASIISLIGCLSTTTTGIAITFSLTAVNNAFETAERLADGSTSAEWLNLVATKPNWTITLV